MRKILLFVLFTIVFSFNLNAQTKKSSNNLQTAINQVRELFFKRDFNSGSDLAKKQIEKYPDSIELKAWYAINLARGDYENLSLEFAKNLVKKHGENEWTLIALTITQAYTESPKSLDTGEKLIKIAPDNEEAIYAYNSVLFRNGKDKEAVEWLQKNKDELKDQSRFLVELASATYYVEKKAEKGDVKKAIDLFAQAVKRNPSSVNANYFYGTYLTLEKKHNEAMPFLKKAVQLSPNGANLRDRYWRTIESQTDKTDAQKKAELEQAINQYLAQTKNSPEGLLAAWNKYRELAGWKEEAKTAEIKKRDYFEKKILQKYPNTKYDEEIAYMQINTVYGKYFGKNDSSKNLEIQLKRKSKRTPEETKFFEEYKDKFKIYLAEQNNLRRAYLKRPKHFDNSKLGSVYLNLFYQLAGNKDSTDEELHALLNGSLEHNKNYYGNLNSYIAGVLHNRQKEQPDSKIAKDAEKFARLGTEEAKNKIKELPKDANAGQTYALLVEPLNTLTDILISQEKLDEAEKILINVSKMKVESDGQNSRLNNANQYTDLIWAKFYTAKKDWTKAEEYYLKISAIDEDFIKTKFEELYEKKMRQKDGFEEYFAGIQEKLKIKAKETVIQTQIKEPKQIIPFSLKTIDDKIVSSAELKNKVIVINIWGVWCSPCVAEMPEFQQLYDKYKDDKEVAVLTLDSNDELDVVKEFITKKKYTFPVMFDDGYVDKIPQFANSRAYPTTLFIDKNGKVSFVVVGASSNLLEVFSWRIDFLKNEIQK